MEKLVSVITPSYNYGCYISRLLDSVLNQTYTNLEMFVIDDGSTDNTKDIVVPYIKKFLDNGKKLQYIYQKNTGLPGAINTGLRNINGDYLVWPDADDWYSTDTAIADLVEVFENSPDTVGLVRGVLFTINEETNKIVYKKGDENRDYPKTLFEQCLFGGNDWWYGAGSYMIKTEHLFYYYPNKEIYWQGYWGQNIQLLFPILYDHDCITINKHIYNLTLNSNSDSRKKRSYVEQIKRWKAMLDMKIDLLDIMKNMPNKEKEYLLNKVYLDYYITCLDLSLSYRKKDDIKHYYNLLSTNDIDIANKYKTKYLLSHIPFGFIMYKYASFAINPKRIINYLKRNIRKILINK